MKKTAMALGALLLATSTAWAETCSNPSAPIVEVVLPAINMVTESADNVAAKAPWPKTMETSLGPGWTINGLTLVRPLVTTQLHTVDRKVGREACVQASKAVLTFSFAEPARIYISGKYAPDSCEYKAILNHEHQHVGIHLNTRAAYSPILRKKVREATSSGARGATPEEASGRLQAKLSAAIDESIREFQSITAHHNGLIDTTESYLTLQANCASW